MASAMLTTIIALVLVIVIALLTGMQHTKGSSVVEILGMNGLFITLFAIAAALFPYAVQKRRQAPGNSGIK